VFFKGSRYENVDEFEIEDPSGRRLRYKKVRFIPPTQPLRGHVVVQGERLDQIAFRMLNDPQRFWRICDANDTMWPEDLVAEIGRTIGIPSPEGQA
jgi:hypothetical protein